MYRLILFVSLIHHSKTLTDIFILFRNVIETDHVFISN
jgi:hypothetical protein